MGVDPGTNVLPDPVYSDEWATLYCGDQFELVPLLGEVDTVITDPPYSARTHAAHNPGTVGYSAGRRTDSAHRRPIGYSHWTRPDVEGAVAAWVGAAAAWVVAMTDHCLAPAYADALHSTGRYVFSPISFMSPGSRVRLGGDGPCQWSVQIVASRPRGKEYLSWGSLPGGYVLPPGQRGYTTSRATGGEATWRIVGGKEEWIMRELIRDYSRDGDTVLDPCAGAGTTLVAARDMRRKSIGIEIDPETAQLAATRLANTKGRMVQQRLAMGE